VSDQLWVLVPKRELPKRPGQWFWTGNDYTSEVARALPFVSQDAADQWLRVHTHLRASLQAAQVMREKADS
jgi:hypothetical protein